MKNGVQNYRIIIVDDQPVARRGMRAFIGEILPHSKCIEVGTVEEAHRSVEKCRPDLVLLDLCMDGMGGADLVKRLHEEHPRLPVLVVSKRSEAVYARFSLAAGAKGFLSKQASKQQLREAIEACLSGRIYISEAYGALAKNKPDFGNGAGSLQVIGVLSKREKEVFECVGRGLAPRHIGSELGISVKTVEAHRRNIREKLCLGSAHELSRFAVYWQKDIEEYVGSHL